jgi:hypothetical protein
MPNSSLPSRVQQAVDSLCQPQPMRRGSFSVRYVKCSKPNCVCHRDPKGRHGPYYSWSRVVKGKTQSRFVEARQASTLQAQIAAGQQFRQDVESYWEACERWADEQLEPTVASSPAAEKKGSQQTFARKSAKRSKRS